MEPTGRWSELAGVEEVRGLKAGMDFRDPRYRREVFLRFYEFHLTYRSHPGCVYYLFPHFFKKFKCSLDERLWMAFVNGNTQHMPTTLAIFSRFPEPAKDFGALEKFFSANYERLAFDTDRRYCKKEFLKSVRVYSDLVGKSQSRFFGELGTAFCALWNTVRERFWSFGRLSTFSYLEYLRIAGVPVECDDLFLDDLKGSKSHRNGLLKVLGRDDLDWHASNPDFDGRYSTAQISWLKAEAKLLLEDARKRFLRAPFFGDVNYFTLESTLCTYKSWHRLNRRYPNVYNDMMYDRIKLAERNFPDATLKEFWSARRVALPEYLRLEDCPDDPGLVPYKQNHYRLTGQVIMMDRMWPCFKNDWNKGDEK